MYFPCLQLWSLRLLGLPEPPVSEVASALGSGGACSVGSLGIVLDSLIPDNM